MSEKAFAFASMSVAIVLGVFFYPPPARHPGQAAPVKPGSGVGQPQQARAALAQTSGGNQINGVD